MIYYYFKNKKNVYKLKKILNYIKNELKINYIDIINLNNFIKNNKILGDNFFIFLIDDLDEKFFDYLNKINESIIGIFFIISKESSLSIIQNLYTKLYTSQLKKENLLVDILNFDNINKNEFYFKLKVTIINLINLFFNSQMEVIKNQEIYIIIKNFIKNLSKCNFINKVFIYSINPFTKVSNLYYNEDIDLSKNEKQKIINIFKNYYNILKNNENNILIDKKEVILFLSKVYKKNVESILILMIELNKDNKLLNIFLEAIEKNNNIKNIIDFINERLLFEYDLERYSNEIKTIYNVSLSFTSLHTEDELIRLVVKKAKNIFKADVSTVMLLDNNTNELYIYYSEGLKPEVIKSTRQKLGQGIAGIVALTGQSLIINDINTYYTEIDYEKEFRSSIVVPLKVKDNKVIGVLSISKYSQYPFSEADMLTLYNLATIAAATIEKAKLYSDVQNYAQQLEETYLSTIESLAKAFEAKDRYNKGHMERVLEYGLAIASELDPNLLNDDVLKLSLLFHDIGKIEVPDYILNKPAKLTDEEYEIIKRHPVAGEEILKPVKFLQEVAKVIRQHQERWDGKGYPDGLKGEEIHLYARIVAVADAFDAMTSDRSYRKSMKVEDAVQEILRNSGTQFDPKVVEAFYRAYKNGLIIVESETTNQNTTHQNNTENINQDIQIKNN
ncbi:MAG: HD domain-containing phosphohydrolase [bacterium]